MIPITTCLRLVSPPLHGWVPPTRRLVLVDIENLVGGSSSSLQQVSDALASLRFALGGSADDVWVTACGPKLLSAAMGAFPSRVLLGRGVDGADRALVDELDPTVVVGRYASVVLVSGDSLAFADAVQVLAERGVPTDVIIGGGFVGASLYRAARSVVAIDHQPPAAA